jgi:hypothetical protein
MYWKITKITMQEETIYYIIHIIHCSLLTRPNTFVSCCSVHFLLTGYEPCLALPVTATLYLSHLHATPQGTICAPRSSIYFSHSCVCCAHCTHLCKHLLLTRVAARIRWTQFPHLSCRISQLYSFDFILYLNGICTIPLLISLTLFNS